MLTVARALEQLLATIDPLDVVDRPLDDTLGMTLGRDIHSTADSPPFDKSSMDGYAVRSADLKTGSASLRVIEVISAGRVPTKPVGEGEASGLAVGSQQTDRRKRQGGGCEKSGIVLRSAEGKTRNSAAGTQHLPG